MNAFFDKYRTHLILLAIVLFALILRVWALGQPDMWIDETISSLASLNLLEKGVPVFDSGIVYSRALMFHYFQTIFLLFGINDFSARFVSVIFGLCTVILAYLIGKEFNRPAGLIAALFTAVIYLEVVYSRQARFYQMFQFLLFLTIFLAYKAKADKKYALFSLISFILLVQTQKLGLILAPLLLYVYTKEMKDVRLSAILVIASAYFSIGILGLASVDTQLLTNYASEYTSGLFDGLRFFALLGLIGIPISYRYNKRLFAFLLIPSVILIFGLLFIKLFAARYLYSVVLLIIILSANLFSYLHKNNKIIFWIVLAIILIYPSNIFFERGYLTVLQPEEISHYSSSEPILEYKSISPNTRELIENNPLVVMWSPGAEWYLKKPDYVIPFSLSGLSSGYTLSDNRDIYTGAEVFDSQIRDFILIEDIFGYLKLNETERARVESIKAECAVLEESRTLRISNCTLTSQVKIP